MIPLFKALGPDRIGEELQQILNAGQLTAGTYTNLFIENIAQFIGNEKFISLSGNSIEFALRVIGIKPDDEVIVAPMSCLASTQPILTAGGKVVWADVDPKTGTLDPLSVESKITKNTKAILHFHWGGFPGYIDEITEISKKYGIRLIEDCTESFGAAYKGHVFGSNYYDICCFSFTGVRLPNAVDGFGISFKSEEEFSLAKQLIDFGINRTNFRDELGEISAKSDVVLNGQGLILNNISSYFGCLNFDKFKSLHLKQKKNAEAWNKQLSKFSSISGKLNDRKEIEPSYWVYTALSQNRDKLLRTFREKGFYASKMHLRNDLYSVFGNNHSEFKGVNEFERCQINLPSGWWVDAEKIMSVEND